MSQLTKYNKDTKNYIRFNKQLTQREKDVRIDKLVGYGELSPIDVLIYIQNSVRKLKSQVMKALEDSILHSNDNIDIKNEEIIKETQQILEKVHQLYYNEVRHCFLPDNVIERKNFKMVINNKEYIRQE